MNEIMKRSSRLYQQEICMKKSEQQKDFPHGLSVNFNLGSSKIRTIPTRKKFYGFRLRM